MNGDQDSNHSPQRKRLLMQIALRRFATDGYHATKISDIVAEAGVAQGTFYWYFKSKEVIALELVKDSKHQLLDVIKQGYRSDPGSVQDMVQASEALLANLFQFAQSNQDVMKLLLQGSVASDPMGKAIGAARWSMENAFYLNICRAMELEMLPATIDARLRAALLMSLIEGVISRWLFGSTDATTNEGLAAKSAQELAAETARFEFYGLLGI